MINWRKPLIIAALAFSNPGIIKKLRTIKKISHWNSDKIKKYQKKELEKLLLHCYEHVPYYRKILVKAGIIDHGRIDLSAFENIPILTKDIIRKNFENLKSDDIAERSPIINHTGGSTGQPLTVYQDKNYYEWNIANKMFYAWIHGKDIGEKEMKLWGSDKDVIENTIGMKNITQYFLYNRRFINSFKFDLEQIENTVKQINSFKPKLLWGYVDSIYALSTYINKNKIDLYNPSIIFTAAGTLFEPVRRTIKRAFPGSRVINVYGSREMGDMAFEKKEKNGLFVFDHSHLMETLPIKGSSQQKRIIVTSLTNYSMPLIRYDIGDASTGFMNEQGGQLHFRRLKDISGRVMTLFKRPDGGYVSPEFFIHMVGVYYNKGDINKFQIIQESLKSVVVKLVPNKKINKETTIKIASVIKKVMGDNCRIKFKIVKDIAKTNSGKYLYAVSKIS